MHFLKKQKFDWAVKEKATDKQVRDQSVVWGSVTEVESFKERKSNVEKALTFTIYAKKRKFYVG